ncbi:hypothetical protein E8E13_006051 [Curvularia kusanoi]|uniref:Uncharacterized protein n=1 Tax=Curvularia kusanoi TaxID=90978 RepID=A0A9P4T7U7_CURKU|nr:hypothetical protein E8E13_006051 [Curvularia kusanoi]
MAAVGVYSLIVGDDAIAKTQAESERFWKVAYRIKFDSLPREITQANGICRDLDESENEHINIY